MLSEAEIVVSSSEARRDEAVALANRLGLPYSDKAGDALTLMLSDEGLSLDGYGMSYKGDFAELARRVTGGHLAHEMLAHVAKTKTEHPTAVDATAGMGEDSFILAAVGYEVTLFERNPIVSALLADAIERAKNDGTVADIVSRMHLIIGDSVELMPSLGAGCDLIYLDPMFPERKKSGLIGKKLQLIQKLERPCSDDAELLDAALRANPKKIVIKRPLKGEYLAGRKPSYQIKGKAIRYDCIAVNI